MKSGEETYQLLYRRQRLCLDRRTVRRVNAHMSEEASHTPREFAGKARPFNAKMKATEWVQALLYTCPIVFQQTMPTDRYKHSLALSVASRMLSTQRFHKEYDDYA